MKARAGLLLICVPLLSAGGWLAENDSNVGRGMEAYRAGRYEHAAFSFRQALVGDADRHLLYFNLGTALAGQALVAPDKESRVRLARLAVAELRRASDGNDLSIRIDLAYNLGNSYVLAEMYVEAMEQYKVVLRAQPSHEWARHNLELAQLLHRGAISAGKESDSAPERENGDADAGEAAASAAAKDERSAFESGTAQAGTATGERPENGPGIRAAPREMSDAAAVDARGIQQKLNALERRSGELRRSRVLRKTLQRARGGGRQ